MDEYQKPKAVSKPGLWYHLIHQFCSQILMVLTTYLLVPYFLRVLHASYLQIIITYAVNFSLILFVEAFFPPFLKHRFPQLTSRQIKNFLVVLVFLMGFALMTLLSIPSWLNFEKKGSNLPAILVPGLLFCLFNTLGQIFSKFTSVLFPKGAEYTCIIEGSNDPSVSYNLLEYVHARELGALMGIAASAGLLWLPFDPLSSTYMMIFGACPLTMLILLVLGVCFSSIKYELNGRGGLLHLGLADEFSNARKYFNLNISVVLLFSFVFSMTFSSSAFFALDWIISFGSSTSSEIFSDVITLSSAIKWLTLSLTFGLLIRLLSLLMLNTCKPKSYISATSIIFFTLMGGLVVIFGLSYFISNLNSALVLVILMSFGFVQLSVFWNFLYPFFSRLTKNSLLSVTIFWKDITEEETLHSLHTINELVQHFGLICGLTFSSVILISSNYSMLLIVYIGLVAFCIVLLVILIFVNLCAAEINGSPSVIKAKNWLFKSRSSIIFKNTAKFL